MAGKRVLIVDDDDSIVLHLSRALRARGWEVLTASTLPEAKSAFAVYSPEMVITDIQLTTMGQREGLLLLKEFKAAKPATRIVVMTAFGTADSQREALDGGAEFYYEKPFDLKELFDRLESPPPAGLPATGCAPASDSTHRASEPAGGRGRPRKSNGASVLLVDDDSSVLGALENALGRMGFLVQTAVTFDKAVELLRDGGFGAVLTDHCVGDSHEERGLEILSLAKAADPEAQVILLTRFGCPTLMDNAFRMGAAGYFEKPVSLDVLRDALQWAVSGHPPPLSTEGSVLDLLSRGFFSMAFQPIREMGTARKIGFEALMRGPKGTPLSRPAELFRKDSSISTGLVHRLDLACVEAALRTGRMLPPETKLFINVRGETLCAAENPSEGLFPLMETLGVPPSRVVLEISETAEKAHVKGISNILHPFRARGMQVALDDVGVRYPWLYHLLHLEPEYIKVDRSFVKGVLRNPRKADLLGGLKEMATRLGAQVISEGVESYDEWKTLAALGIPLGQGFWGGVPKSALEWLNDSDREYLFAIKLAGASDGEGQPFLERDGRNGWRFSEGERDRGT